ncbi:MAG: hypothetical protein WDN08_10250 [Rhizomicrobium sp.]
MQPKYLAATALALVLAASAVLDATAKPSRPPTPPRRSLSSPRSKPTSPDVGYENHAAWVRATYIIADTDWLAAKASAEGTTLSVRYAKEAARFDHVQVDDVTRRKLYLLKQGLVLPASSRPAPARNSPTSGPGSRPTMRPRNSPTTASR